MRSVQFALHDIEKSEIKTAGTKLEAVLSKADNFDIITEVIVYSNSAQTARLLAAEFPEATISTKNQHRSIEHPGHAESVTQVCTVIRTTMACAQKIQDFANRYIDSQVDLQMHTKDRRLHQLAAKQLRGIKCRKVVGDSLQEAIYFEKMIEISGMDEDGAEKVKLKTNAQVVQKGDKVYVFDDLDSTLETLKRLYKSVRRVDYNSELYVQALDGQTGLNWAKYKVYNKTGLVKVSIKSHFFQSTSDDLIIAFAEACASAFVSGEEHKLKFKGPASCRPALLHCLRKKLLNDALGQPVDEFKCYTNESEEDECIYCDLFLTHEMCDALVERMAAFADAPAVSFAKFHRFEPPQPKDAVRVEVAPTAAAQNPAKQAAVPTGRPAREEPQRTEPVQFTVSTAARYVPPRQLVNVAFVLTVPGDVQQPERSFKILLRPREVQVAPVIMEQFTKRFPAAQYLEVGNVIQVFLPVNKFDEALAAARKIKLGDNLAHVEE